MLFSSSIFLFGFLPVAVAAFALATLAGGRTLAAAWLLLASLFFYAYWHSAHLLLLVGSVLANYACGMGLARNRSGPLLVLGIAGNLALIGYFKYAGFLVDSATSLFGRDIPGLDIALPLAISFFTFQQIAYLVDIRRGHPPAPDLLRYALFVVFFPHLIAGPLLHHAQIIPQFQKDSVFRIARANLLIGAAIFAVGLYKKVVLADGIALYATPVFDNAVHAPPEFFRAWSGALAYTFQLYFDFSGYSDMAIGLARLFGVRLPVNFNSPYKAASIIDFWRRWHITLSRFLRDYLYVPLGGNRKGPLRRQANVMVTMILGGLWHGAAWTFVAWGALHGLYLLVNHAWRSLRRRIAGAAAPSAAEMWLGRTLTFLAVVIGWVLFRARSFEDAMAILRGMAGGNGILLPPEAARFVDALPLIPGIVAYGHSPILAGDAFLWIAVLLAVAWFAPNTQRILGHLNPTLEPGADGAVAVRFASAERRSLYNFFLAVAFGTSLIVAALIIVARGGQSGEFIYMIF